MTYKQLQAYMKKKRVELYEAHDQFLRLDPELHDSRTGREIKDRIYSITRQMAARRRKWIKEVQQNLFEKGGEK